ncbi:MAG: hypothetical protein FJW20_03425 [Acidimicrobiia bacterium]|nr:hypothetical protein [Acidimicrobiia bacterium]
MSVLVRVDNRKAILRAGRWVCSDRELESQLNEETSRWISETGGPPIHAADQERTVAKEIAGRFGGRVVLYLKSASGKSEQYFYRQRQLQLDFSSSVPLSRRRAQA